MKHIVVLQARMSSTRLPGKSLLPIRGYSCVSLAALRAANAASDVVVATSSESSDDPLAKELTDRGIAVFRGPLNDVLARYYLAVADLAPDTVVIRLTGDNVIPDGDLVREFAAMYAESGAEYLADSHPQSGLPYGVCGEAFSVEVLRRAHVATTNPFDREHVGPWMARNVRAKVFTPHSTRGRDFSYLRCTIDDQEDYRRVCLLFEGISSPLSAGWLELVEKLARLPGEPAFGIPWHISGGRIQSEMTLGTVQFGMDYGIVNRTGKPPRLAAVAMTREAIAHGVRSLDTARAYGESEEVLKDALAGAWRSRVEVITKLDPLSSLPADSRSADVRAAVDESVRNSCLALGVEKLQTLLLHRWSLRTQWRGAAWNRLLELRATGTIGALGVSVYHPHEALEALEDAEVRHIQVPFNVLDYRWRECKVPEAACRRQDVIVHARSVLLQGLLAHSIEEWPATFQHNLASFAGRLASCASRLGRESVVDLCLAYVRSQNWIASLVLGCETMDQVRENLRLFLLPKLSAAQCEELDTTLPRAHESLLDPSRWKTQ